MATLRLKEVDEVEILTVLDNTVDMLMAGTPHAKRFPLRADALARESRACVHLESTGQLGWKCSTFTTRDPCQSSRQRGRQDFQT